MTKATVLVSHLMMNDGMFNRGDIIELTEERIKSLGSSVRRIEPTKEEEPEKPKEEIKEVKKMSLPKRRVRKK